MDKQQAAKKFLSEVEGKHPSWSELFYGGWEAHEAQSPTDAVAFVKWIAKKGFVRCFDGSYNDLNGYLAADTPEDLYKVFNPSGAAAVFKCPSCGNPWDTEKHKACECGATISAGAAPQTGNKTKEAIIAELEFALENPLNEEEKKQIIYPAMELYAERFAVPAPRAERKRKEEIIKSHFSCTCDKIYTSRGMIDPACNLHELGGEIELIMEEYAQQFAASAPPAAGPVWVKVEDDLPLLKNKLYQKESITVLVSNGEMMDWAKYVYQNSGGKGWVGCHWPPTHWAYIFPPNESAPPSRYSPGSR